ncbi:MAG: alanine racemase [Chthoniobacterales bacterium]|nr:alanine racemase [Chthoniobacterales bacterium]
MTRIPANVRTWVEVDLSAIQHNARLVRSLVGPGSAILAVVKADAYGHGVKPVVRALAEDVEIFGVANLREAREIASAGTGRDIMILSPCLPAERRGAVAGNFIVTVSSAAEAAAYSSRGAARLNFKIDTGMGRVGCHPDSAIETLRDILHLPRISIHSISTHLPSADEDPHFTEQQLLGFSRLLARLREILPDVRAHSLNSAGILTSPSDALEIVRPGLMLYGSSPVPELQEKLRPALAWKTRVSLVRDIAAGTGIGYGRTFIAPHSMRVAVLAAGYADGYPRQVSGRGAEVLIHGKNCPLLGRVTMDQLVVDVSKIPEVREGDTATLLGSDPAGGEIPAARLAALADTIPWDIFTGIGQRVRRFHSRA